jgi:serine/threonine-protein kinase HipA
MNSTIEVHADWDGTEPLLLGHLGVHDAGAREVFDFEFAPKVLSGKVIQGFQLDPSLPNLGGKHLAPGGSLFGVFQDASPDRWGRRLMDRRFARLQGKDQPTKRKLKVSEYLLGVHDLFRLGALRLRRSGESEFAESGSPSSAPPFVRLRELEAACRQLEEDAGDFGAQMDAHLLLLLAPGASLGGARPKCAVEDPSGRLYMAKFPSVNDDFDVGAWEWVVHQLARRCGIQVSNGQLQQFASKHHTFLSERFDRTPTQDRIHFASAMTMTGHHDGDDASTGASYLEIAEAIMRFGSSTDADLRQLWTRIVFNMLVSNTDDHLRNHGFLLDPRKGWRLSPAFDMNPSPHSRELRLNVTEDDNACDLELALGAADWFRVSAKDARVIVDNCKAAVQGWRALAKEAGLPASEVERMSGAFALSGPPASPVTGS